MNSVYGDQYPARITKSKKVLVTGGLGFIGSHLVDALIESHLDVVVLDNRSGGWLQNVGKWLDEPTLVVIEGDILDGDALSRAIEGCDTVFHLAGSSEVRTSIYDTRAVYEQNTLATWKLLEAMRGSESCRRIVFASTSAVYGEAKTMPTPETYGPLKPISFYGSTKLASESLLCGYSHLFRLNAVALRLANVVGVRSRRGVVYDFLEKLRFHRERLEVLGDGHQTKSYMYIDDCINAFLVVASNMTSRFETYNVGSDDRLDVLSIARLVAAELRIPMPEIACSNSTEGGGGWIGDVKEMLLDTSKIKALGWKPHWTSGGAVSQAARDQVQEPSMAISVPA